MSSNYKHKKSHQIFLKERIRHAADFALVSVALAARVSDGICEQINLVLGGIAPTPCKLAVARDMIKGRKLDEKLIIEAAESSVKDARPLRMNGYKVDLAKALVKRALTAVANDSEGR